MAKRPALSLSPLDDFRRRMPGWIPGVLIALAGPTLLVASGFSALTEIRPATSAPAAAVNLDSEEQQFLNLINDYRQGQGLPTLSIDPQLEAASRWMSADMATNDYFSHYDSLGRDPFQRMAAFGYDYNVWKGENLAAGTAGAQVAFDSWKASPGHNSNMTNPNFVGVGIARDYGADSGLGWYWTTDFGGLVNSEPAANPTVSPTRAAPPVTPTPTAKPSRRPTPTTEATPAPDAGRSHGSGTTPTAARTPRPTATPRPTPGPGRGSRTLQGDLDCKGVIEARDGLLLLRIVVGARGAVCRDGRPLSWSVRCLDPLTADYPLRQRTISSALERIISS